MFSLIRPAKLCQVQCKSLHMAQIGPPQTGGPDEPLLWSTLTIGEPYCTCLAAEYKLIGQSEQGKHLGIRGNRVPSAPSGVVLSPLTPVLHVSNIGLSTNKNTRGCVPASAQHCLLRRCYSIMQQQGLCFVVTAGLLETAVMKMCSKTGKQAVLTVTRAW